MRTSRWFLVSIVVASTILLALAAPSSSAKASSSKDAAACAKLGFPDPLCSTCDALSLALPPSSSSSSSSSSSTLDTNCRSCCTPDDGGADGAAAAFSFDSSLDSSLPKASSAILEVCRSRLRAHRHVDEFVRSKLAAFKGQVKLRDRYSAPPRIYFLDAKGKRTSGTGGGGGGENGGSGGSGGASPVRIDHWRTEDIESFLRERLSDDWKGTGKKEGKKNAAA